MDVQGKGPSTQMLDIYTKPQLRFPVWKAEIAYIMILRVWEFWQLSVEKQAAYRSLGSGGRLPKIPNQILMKFMGPIRHSISLLGLTGSPSPWEKEYTARDPANIREPRGAQPPDTAALALAS